MCVSAVINSSVERSCVCIRVVEMPGTGGDRRTPMERVKKGGTAEAASLTFPPSFCLSLFPDIEGSRLYTT